MPEQPKLFKMKGPYWRACPRCGRVGFWEADEPLCPKCMTHRGGYVDEAERERKKRLAALRTRMGE